MTDISNMQGIDLDKTVGQTMSFITFGELIKEITGEPFEVIYKDYIESYGDKNEQDNLE